MSRNHSAPAAQFVGECACVRIGDRPVMPGDIVAEPSDVVAELLLRSDFAEAHEHPNEHASPAADKPHTNSKGEE